MIFADTLRSLLRRWYITFPGIVLAIAVYLAFLTAMQYFGDDTTSTVKTSNSLGVTAAQIS